MNDKPIVVIGYGWVGQANALALSLDGNRVYFFDVAETPTLHYAEYALEYKKIERLKDVRSLDGEDATYIVCVGDRVAEDGVQDISLIKKAVEQLQGVKGTVVLRSTIIPSFLAGLAFDYYVPEFLHEKKAVEEARCPYYLVIGKKTNRPEPHFFKQWRKNSHKIFTGTPEEASYVKYLSNVWNSLRIAFVNEFGNAIVSPPDKEGVKSIQKVLNFAFDGRAYMRYGKSFDGHCLPKDTRAFVRFLKDSGKNAALLEGTYTSNDFQKKLEKEYPTLPEWYSEWPDRHISAKVALGALWHSFIKRLPF